MGRKVAKETLEMHDFRLQMEGIVAKISESTLDESPSAYKNILDIIRLQQQEGLIDVVNIVKPIINIKA
jgi:RNA-splicing ligase RtcB